MSESELPLDIQKWLASFKEKHSRPVRVLHIGNIANNAYINAKLLNHAGLDCDVICYDYYHIMGCPEWEDADFEGDFIDEFYPAWERLDLRGFRRPRWFAQGFHGACIRYLIARRQKKALSGPFWWWILKISSRSLCAAVRRGYLPLIKRSGLMLYSLGKRLVGVWTFLFKEVSEQYHRSSFGFSRCGHPRYYEELTRNFRAAFPERSDQLTVDDLLFADDWILRNHPIRKWKELFGYYDIVQAYSTDGILPLLTEKRPFCCFEHGTLRSIPFEASARGRRTTLTYHLADHVFVTNSDCLNNARYLANGRVSFINHPYDQDHALSVGGWEVLRKKLRQKLDAEFLIFFPTRHDWVPGTGYADKANDLFLRSFSRLIKEGFRVGLVCCNWGANVRESMELLRSCGCSDRVSWSQPMGSVKFERTAKACDITADQFKLGSFGGVMFKAMAVGSPICTYLDEQEMLMHYQEIPPIINCRTEEEIVLRLRQVFKEPACLERLGVLGRKWIKKYHNSKETIVKQLETYRELLV